MVCGRFMCGVGAFCKTPLPGHPFVVGKGIGRGVLLVGFMRLGAHQPPVVAAKLRKPHVGMLGSGIHLRQIEAVGKGQCLGIHRRAADDEHLFVLLAMREGFGQRGETFGTGKSRGGARQHDVAAIGQCALGQRLKRAPPHDDGMSRGELLETAQVGRKSEEQPVVVTDGAVARHGADDIDHEFFF